MALSAIGGGVGAGLGASTTVSNVIGSISGNALVQAGIQGALASAITQGIGTATGLQDKFSWAAVAAAGVSRVAGLRFGEGTAGGITAATLADAATRSLIDGSDFGDNMLAALPNMFAQMAMMRPTPRVEAQGSSDDSAPYMSYKSNVLNREVSNAQSPRRGLLSMALDWLGRAIVGDFSPRPDKTVTERDSGADDLSFTEYDPLTIYAVPRDQYGIPRSAVSMLLNSQRTISDERIRDALARASMEGRPATIQSPLYQPGPLQSPIMMQDRTFEDFSYSDAMIQYESDRAFRRAIAGRDYPMAGVAGGISSAFGADSDTQDTFVVAGVTFDSVAGAWAGPRAFSPTGGRYSPRPLTTPEYDYASVNGMGRHRPYADSRRRPTYASGQVETVWRRHQRDGQVFDPNVGAKLTWYRNQTRAGQWDMGHVPGREYRELHRMYMSGQISLTEFLREYRNPANYRPEQPGANRSRRYEGGN